MSMFMFRGLFPIQPFVLVQEYTTVQCLYKIIYIGCHSIIILNKKRKFLHKKYPT